MGDLDDAVRESAAQTLRHGGDFWAGYVGYHVGARATSKVVPGLSVGEMLDVLASERLLLILGAVGLSLPWLGGSVTSPDAWGCSGC